MLLGIQTVSKVSDSKLSVIAGVTQKMGVPSAALVRIFYKPTSALLKTIKTNSDGVFKAYLPKGTYIVIATNYSNIYNAVIQDNVVPK